MTLNSLGSGWFRFRGWFVFALVDGMVCERLLFGLSGWSGLVWLVWSGCTLVWGRSCYSFCSVCSFVRFVLYTVCCMLYSFCLVFALLILT